MLELELELELVIRKADDNGNAVTDITAAAAIHRSVHVNVGVDTRYMIGRRR